MDAVRVERHVADCAPCRQRLDEARALVQRAARLLEWASPPERAAPPLSDLRPMAPRWRTPVAWAATIVIALGVGLYGGKRLFTERPAASLARENRSTEAAEKDQLTAPAIVATVDSQNGARRADPRSTVTEPQPAAAATPPAAKAESVAVPSGALAVGGDAAQQRADTATRPADSAPRLSDDSVRRLAAAAARSLAMGARTQRDSISRVEERALAPAAAPAAVPPAAQVLPLGAVADRAAPVDGNAGDRNLSRSRRFLTTTTWPVITRDSATRLLRAPIVALPDVPITNVRAASDAILVEHVLPPGQVIQLIERRATAEEYAATRASELLARYVGGLRVEIAGPFSADSLSKLLERVRALP
jgi:hypothetical protein